MPTMRALMTILREADQGDVVRRVPNAEAHEMLDAAYFGGKNKHLEKQFFKRHEVEDYVLVDLPLQMIQPNEEGDRYDATSDIDRIHDYMKIKITTPIFVTFNDRSTRLGMKVGYVADGGHRVSAARMRGDTHIRALMRQSDFDRLVAIT